MEQPVEQLFVTSLLGRRPPAFPFGFALHIAVLEGHNNSFTGAELLFCVEMEGSLLQQSNYQPEGN